ncbi:MAG TPA: hypothetical protein VIY72_06090 [Acidimicrobiales bacterium]
MYAVGCSTAPGEPAVVLGHAPTVEQAFEVVEMVVRERLGVSGDAGAVAALGEALHDLLAEGPQGYGWWNDAAGFEVWYGPVTAAVPEGLERGELALLATVASSTVGLAAAC